MIRKLSAAVETDGSAAFLTSQLDDYIDGYVLGPQAMAASLDERQEQINSLLKALNKENIERVAADLKRVILTVHIPKQAEDDIEAEFEQLKKPVMLRLSPVGTLGNPLDPTIVLGLNDMKSVLDAMRMLYAEMYSEHNLATGDTNRNAGLIMQPMPFLDKTFRVIPAGNYTVIEGSYGYSAWVGYGEPDRFLFEGTELKKYEPGDHKGIIYDPDMGAIDETTRRLTTEDDAKKILEFAKPLVKGTAPLLLGSTMDGIACFGCLAPLPESKE